MRDRNALRPNGHILEGREHLLALESFMTQYWYAIAKIVLRVEDIIFCHD